MKTVVFYIALALFHDRIVSRRVPFDDAQQACISAADAGEKDVLKVTYGTFTKQECCDNRYAPFPVPDLVKSCMQEDNTWECPIPFYTVETMECVAAPSFTVRRKP